MALGRAFSVAVRGLNGEIVEIDGVAGHAGQAHDRQGRGDPRAVVARVELQPVRGGNEEIAMSHRASGYWTARPRRRSRSNT